MLEHDTATRLGRYDTARRTIAPVLDGSQPIRQADEADHETLAGSPGAGVSRVFGSSGVPAPPNSGSTAMPAFEFYRVKRGALPLQWSESLLRSEQGL